MEKPEATNIRKESKRILKIRAAQNNMTLVDYLEHILKFYFDEIEKGKIDELERIREQKARDND